MSLDVSLCDGMQHPHFWSVQEHQLGIVKDGNPHRPLEGKSDAPLLPSSFTYFSLLRFRFYFCFYRCLSLPFSLFFSLFVSFILFVFLCLSIPSLVLHPVSLLARSPLETEAELSKPPSWQRFWYTTPTRHIAPIPCHDHLHFPISDQVYKMSFRSISSDSRFFLCVGLSLAISSAEFLHVTPI